jgi:hypothetical protein
MSVPILWQVYAYGGLLVTIAGGVGFCQLITWLFPPRRDGGSWGFGHGFDEWIPRGPDGKPDWKKFHEELDEIGKDVKIHEEEMAASAK